MTQTTPTATQAIAPTNESELANLKKRIKKLNSRAGQMKMDLHDIAEGLPTDLEKLPEAAIHTYEIYCQLRDLKQQLKTLEESR